MSCPKQEQHGWQSNEGPAKETNGFMQQNWIMDKCDEQKEDVEDTGETSEAVIM